MIPLDYEKRIDLVISQAWDIFKSQFIRGKIIINKEAPFQHHFANIIKNLGDLYCIERNEFFIVDLETKCPNIKNKNKYLDITCGFSNASTEFKISIELKFKTSQQGAQDHGRIDSYIDIEALELSQKEDYKKGYFFMITDSSVYINPSNKGVGTVFSMHEGFQSKSGTFQYPSKGREDIIVELKKSYKFKWEKIESFYFLNLEVFN